MAGRAPQERALPFAHVARTSASTASFAPFILLPPQNHPETILIPPTLRPRLREASPLARATQPDGAKPRGAPSPDGAKRRSCFPSNPRLRLGSQAEGKTAQSFHSKKQSVKGFGSLNHSRKKKKQHFLQKEHYQTSWSRMCAECARAVWIKRHLSSFSAGTPTSEKRKTAVCLALRFYDWTTSSCSVRKSN